MGIEAATLAAYAAVASAGAAGYSALTQKKPEAPDMSAQNEILARQEKQAADEKNRLASEQMARLRAARTGGFRSLLSDQSAQGLRSTLGPG